MKKILLTGARGFIGRHCCTALRERNYEIHAATSGNVEDVPEDEGVSWYHLDLLEQNSVTEVFRQIKPTHLLHLAWYTEHGKFWNAEENLVWTNATLQLIKEFKNNGGQRVVGAGTCAEYDWNYGYCSEHVTPLNPSSLYGRCKNAVRSIIDEYTSLYDLSFAWGRIFFLYGQGENRKRLISHVITSLLENRTADCSHGKQIRDFLYVTDVANAFVSLLDSEVEGAVNIASGTPVTLRSIIETISTKLDGSGKIRYGTVPEKPGDPPMLTADIRRLENEVGWKPGYELDQGIEETINWWKNNLEKV